jgi:uncharacterized phage-associated protein
MSNIIHNLYNYAYGKIKVVIVAFNKRAMLTEGNMRNFKAIDIADWFIARSNREKKEEFGEGISNLKLQKILYFAQAAKLSLDNEPLFDDEIYAWNYGPVINDVYHAHKKHVNTPIKKPKGIEYTNFSNETSAFLEDVWQTFAKYSPAKLVEITHSHAPWKDTYDGTKDKVITKETIKKYYKNVFVRV